MNQMLQAPNIHNNIRCPPDSIPILEFYKGYYDCVYIMLHPFKQKKQHNTKPLSWKEIQQLTGFKSIKQIDVALRAYISGINKDNMNDYDLNVLEQLCLNHNLIIPPEGDFSEFLEKDMLRALLSQGYEWVYVGDEFGFERKIEETEKLLKNESDIHYPHPCWYTVKNEILFTTHWDSHFTLLCSEKETVKAILEKHPFEGFYCEANTEIYWSLQQQ